MDELKMLLVELREAVKQVQERAAAPHLPLVMSYDRAAKELDVHVSTVKRMVKSGELQAVKVHGRMGIPRTEIERIATPKAPMPKGGRSRATKHDPKSERAKLGDALKRRR